MHAGDIMSCMQYTIRNIPPEVDQALKARAKQLGKSVNQLALEVLTQSLGQETRHRNLRNMPGSWTKQDAARFDESLADQRQIDEELWK
jgi:plasmid stability protein